ncbi:AgmX/PglI C-terminal domain-containing protein [Pyxidicoccus trucidator]|uniref:AgmX/PglI C-terminal domain-containing protein n=1 Tax=Pyxidicoccus trucidator TaxID=2709662 RepID=UPI0013DA31D9|nr:AgmX/PglI C-terminal domain-containing protein [Pyxidicoccus trucidator]
MNFTCDNCQKRYSIADEKVRGKTVKVRCKNCQNVITVEGPAEEESTRVVSLADVERIRAQERSLVEPAAAAVSAPPVAASPVSRAPAAALQTPWDDEPTRAAPLKPTGSPWFVMVRNKQEGPLDEGALREWMATGAVSGRSFFWQQGMADWKRGSDIPELAGLFAPPPAPEPPPPPPPPVAEPPPAPARSARGASARREPEPQPFLPEPEPEQPYAPDEPQQQAWDPEQDEPERTFFEEPDPRQQQQAQGRRGQGAAPAASAPLNNDELFSDLDLPGNRGHGDEDDGQGQHEDPLAALGGGDGDERQPVEDTRHFAAKSGVTRRNPAWKYAVAVLLLLVIPLGGAYVLSETLGVVPLRVKTVDAEGNPVEQTVFSSKGVGALRDKLMGRQPPAPAPKPVAPPAEKRPAAPPESAPAPTGAAPAGAGAPTGIAPPPSAEQLQAVYADADKKDVGPDVREDADVAAADSEEVGGPSDEEVERVVDKAQDAFRSCVENELRKNPSFRVGKVTLTATVGSSGKVKAASLDKKDLNRSTVGTCIRDRAKGMVFSAFAGEDVDLEIPLVLSGTL